MAISVRRTQGQARDDSMQNPQYLYVGITHASPYLQSTPGVLVGVLPPYALKQDTIVRINTTFDGEMTIGTSGSQSLYGSTADIVAGSADVYVVDTGYGTRSTGEQPVYVRLTSGTTIGGADIWIEYLKGDSAGSTA